MPIEDHRPRRHIELHPDFTPVITADTERRRWSFILQEACIARSPGAGPVAAGVMLVVVVLVLVSGFAAR
jgi:hypothetical protein